MGTKVGHKSNMHLHLNTREVWYQVEYAIKKDRLLLEVNKQIDTQTMINLIAIWVYQNVEYTPNNRINNIGSALKIHKKSNFQATHTPSVLINFPTSDSPGLPPFADHQHLRIRRKTASTFTNYSSECAFVF